MSFEKPEFTNKPEPGPDSMPESPVPTREELNKFEDGPEPLEPDTIPEEEEFSKEEEKTRREEDSKSGCS